MSDGDINLGDLVSAFQLELRDGLAKMDSLGRSLAEFEGTAKARFNGVGQAGEDNATRMAGAFKSSLDSIASRFASFLVGAFGIGAMIAGLKSLGETFISENAEMDQYVNRLAGVTGGLKTARAEVERLEALSAATGANTGELVDAYVKLKQVGIDPTNDSLKALGGAALSANTSIANVAQAMAMATMDAGRGLKQFGIQMTETAGQATFQWTNAAGELKRITVNATDAMIQATLLAIWNDKFAGRMDQAALEWKNMTERLRVTFNQFLEEIGTAGAWTEFKAQVAGILGEFQALKGEDLKTWAASMSEVLGALAQALGAMSSTLLEMPVAFMAFVDGVGMAVGRLGVVVGNVSIAILKAVKAVMSAMPGGVTLAVGIDKAIAELSTDVNALGLAAYALDREMVQNALTLHRLQQAGINAADGYRAAAKGAGDAGSQLDETTAKIRKLNSAFDDEGQKLLATYGVFNQVKLNEEMAKIVKAADDLHQHGVPANEILTALGPTVTKLKTAADDFGTGFQLPDEFRRLSDGAASGKMGMEDFLLYMDDRAWKSLKTGADDAVVSVTKAGGGIAEALKGGFGRGFDDAFAGGEKKFQALVARIGQQTITIGVDINDMDLLAKLMRLGFTPKGMDNTGGTNRPG